MDFNLEVRYKQLESLEQFISSSRDKVQSVIDCLNWNTEKVIRDDNFIKCPIDYGHRISARTSEAHIEKCSLKKEGYNINELFLSVPINNFNSSILIDNHQKIEILSAAHKTTPGFNTAWNGQDPHPKTSNRLTSTYSSDERLALYKHTVKSTKGPPEPPEFNVLHITKEEGKTLTKDELRKRERDAKRRRIKYKAIHTNRKSYKEILKEVIEGQMELYRDWLVDNDVASTKEIKLQEPSSLGSDEHTEDLRSESSSMNRFERDRSVNSRNSTISDSSRSTSKFKEKCINFSTSYEDIKDNHYNKEHRNKDLSESRKNGRSHSRHRHNNTNDCKNRERSHSRHHSSRSRHSKNR